VNYSLEEVVAVNLFPSEPMSTISSVLPRNSAALADPALKRVLYAIVLDPSRKFGSLEEQIFILGRAFQERGGLFLPLFLCPGGPDKLHRYHDAGLPAECLDLGSFSLPRLWKLAGLVRRQRIDIVHWNFTHPLGNRYLWGLSLLTPGVKHYFTDHTSRFLPLPGPGKGIKAAGKRLLLKRYQKVLCVSRFVEDCLTQQKSWSNLHRCLHFINTDRFKADAQVRSALRQTVGAENNFVIVTVAHLIKAKGVDVVIQALARLHERTVLWVVGEGVEEEALRQLSNELGLGQRVRFMGNQAHVQPYLQAADCFVCPSLWAEAAGLVNLEAQATGLPVLASNIGGIPEYVDDGHTGLLFPPGDDRALADCLNRLLDDPNLRAQMGRQARQATIARFSPESRLNAYLDLYR
jgi:glycosyltransferase involved in cell wall biosynthesis